jgi:cold shock CspA family protein
MSQDILILCAECSVTFVWTAAGQASEPRPALCPACRRLAPAPGRQRGIVKWFNHGKGYGFITPPRGSELFVHKSALPAGQPFPRAGQLVEFTVATAARGMQAEEVVVLEAAGQP